MVTIQRDDFDALFTALKERGYTLAGPTVFGHAIEHDVIETTADLPVGLTDKQSAARYRIEKRNDAALFGYVVGPEGWKQFLFPSRVKLMTAVKKGKTIEFSSEASENSPAYAFIGVRSCELHAIGIQDKVFASDQYADPIYKTRREKAFILALNCTEAGGNCFCVSMKTGPKVNKPFDLLMTEVVGSGTHYFLIEEGSDRGKDVMKSVPHKKADQKEIDAANALVEKTSQSMVKKFNADGIEDVLKYNQENSRWDDVEKRCLMCANCTMVCPTCFCSTVEDVTSLSGDQAARWRCWDSCFTLEFAKVTGGNYRFSPKARYRHWLTHKLASWVEQFGTYGCVGCGRCITWCPVGIDITAEAQAIRTNSARPEAQ
jgi:sulfhydrogenase subunit beta (sulfur reductase)